MKKKISSVLIVLVLIAVTNKEPEIWIKSNFKAKINSNPDRAYNITYSEIELNFSFDGITLKKVAIEPLNHKKESRVKRHFEYATLNGLRFYPVTRGSAEYDLGSPLVKEAIIHLNNGKKVSIKATNQSTENIYVESVSINGKIIEGTQLSHNDISNGGEIIFEMTDKEN